MFSMPKHYKQNERQIINYKIISGLIWLTFTDAQKGSYSTRSCKDVLSRDWPSPMECFRVNTAVLILTFMISGWCLVLFCFILFLVTKSQCIYQGWIHIYKFMTLTFNIRREINSFITRNITVEVTSQFSIPTPTHSCPGCQSMNETQIAGRSNSPALCKACPPYKYRRSQMKEFLGENEIKSIVVRSI